MSYYLAKIAVTTILIVAISEIAKRSSLIGAILASIPFETWVEFLSQSWHFNSNHRGLLFSHGVSAESLRSKTLKAPYTSCCNL